MAVVSAMASTESDDHLTSLLQKSQNVNSILPDELSYLITAFIPSEEPSTRSKAYLVLSSYCQGVRSASRPPKDGEPDPGTSSLFKTFGPIVEARVAEPTEQEALVGLSFLSALFQVDWQTASSIFQQDTIITCITDILDLYPSDAVSREAAHLLSQASGHKTCRAVIPADCVQWLEASTRQTKDASLRAAAAVAMVKLSRGAKSDSVEIAGGQEALSGTADDQLVSLMKGLVVDGDKASLTDAVEGLAYLSVEPRIKEVLAKDSSFLTRLFSLVPSRKGTSSAIVDTPNHTLLYGILTIISNVCAYRPKLSAEDAQIDKLRRMAKAGSKSSDPLTAGIGAGDALDDDEYVKQRGRSLVKAGALNVLVAVVRLADSQGVRVTASRALLHLVEDKENRGKILQSGGARTLVDIIRKSISTAPSTSAGHSDEADPFVLEPIQALAKLSITASPVQVYGPDSGAIYDAVRPFTILLTHSSSNLLQRFEAMMALTNISSHSPEAAIRVAKADGLLTKVEFLMLEDHTLIRRAATELLCNLMSGSEDVFERYTGNGTSESAKSKLHVLLALSDVDDLPTRLAASGALATLTSSPHACRSLYDLERERHRVLRIFTQLIDPSVLDARDEEPAAGDAESDPGLVHRGVVCVRNFLLTLDAGLRKTLVEEVEMKDLLKGLVNVVKANGQNPAVLRPTAEALKVLMDSGMTIAAT